jgi:cell cycle checkpoint protein
MAQQWELIMAQRILLLTGPAGTGKTTTVKVLAKQLGIDVVEWSEGVEERSIGSGFGGLCFPLFCESALKVKVDRESSMTKLSSFLSRHSYAPLALSDQHSSSSRSKIRDQPRLLLLTSLPNLTHLPTRQAFHSALLSFCQTYTSASCPLVIVHSEAGSGGKAEESWMNRDRGGREGALELVGREVRDGPWCQEVE